jgi:uncharacterized membrane protein
MPGPPSGEANSMTQERDVGGPAPVPADEHLAALSGAGRARRWPGGLGRPAPRLGLAVLIPAAVITLAGVIWLWPSGDAVPHAADPGTRRVDATVQVVEPQPCPPPPEGTPPVTDAGACGVVIVRLTSGPDAGNVVSTDIPYGPGAPAVHRGDRVVLMYLPDNPVGHRYQILDHQRGRPLWILAFAFVAAVVAFGRWRGVRALVGLAVTFAVLLLFIVPAILAGREPLLVAIVGSAAIALTVLYLTHGLTTPTSVAVLGTLASLVLTGVLAAAATGATRLTGVASEEDTFLTQSFQGVNMKGLLLAGIVIGALGVLDDVAVTQAATVTELAQANAGYGVRELYRAASRIGRAHIASVVNTIILAYAGASLPVLLLLAASDQPVADLLTNQALAQEIVRSIVGTIGLIAAVPITTALAAVTVRRPAARPPVA